MSERAAASGWLATAAVVLGAGALFALLHQRAMHGEDTRLFVLWLAAGPNGDVGALPRHFLFLPLLHAFGDLLRPLGASWYTVLWLAAVLGSALGLGALHRAARTLVPSGASPLWLPLALSLVPTWFFFATAAEIHGVFVLPLGLSWWALTHFLQRPNVAALPQHCTSPATSCCRRCGSRRWPKHRARGARCSATAPRWRAGTPPPSPA